MKKILIIALALVFVLAGCNRKAFLKKIEGTWQLSKYLYAGLDHTRSADTTLNSYKLTLNSDEMYQESWLSYSFRNDSTTDSVVIHTTIDTVPPDTFYYYTYRYDTFRFVDTTIRPYLHTGKWDLLNSEEDLQLRDDSDNTARIYRILGLTKSELDLRKGNEEWYLRK